MSYDLKKNYLLKNSFFDFRTVDMWSFFLADHLDGKTSCLLSVILTSDGKSISKNAHFHVGRLSHLSKRRVLSKGQIKEKGIKNMLTDFIGMVLLDLILFETEFLTVQSMRMGSIKATKVGFMMNS